MKKRKKGIILICAGIAVVAIAVAAIILLRNHNISVYVQPVEYINESWILSNASLSGTVEEQSKQKLYLDSDKTIAEFYVKVGDTVKKGDKLFAYDTESAELSVSEKELSIEIYNNEIENLGKKLDEYEAIVPVESKPAEPVAEEAQEPAENTDMQDTEAEDDTVQEDDVAESETTYTFEEKQQLIRETKLKINETKNSLGIAENELDKAKLQLSNAEVTAAIDGKVTAINEKGGSQPVCVVTGDGSALLRGYLSEFDLDTAKVGDTVAVSSYSGAFCEAEIQYIDHYPADGVNLYREGNQNTSYYAFTALMNGADGFETDEEVTVQMNSAADSSVIVLPKVYVRKDKDGSYVMIDADGRLKRQPVTTARSPRSGYVVISDGLTAEDKIAFPYGNGLKEGARTTEEYTFNLF